MWSQTATSGLQCENRNGTGVSFTAGFKAWRLGEITLGMGVQGCARASKGLEALSSRHSSIHRSGGEGAASKMEEPGEWGPEAKGRPSSRRRVWSAGSYLLKRQEDEG